MMVLLITLMMALLIVILLADMEELCKITAVILLVFSLILSCANTSFSVERGKEAAMKSFCTQYTKTELYNMSDAEKDLLPKTYGDATIKYWKIDDKKDENK